jgi:hypothetical protein
MRKLVLLQTAVLLAATVNFSYVAASCVPPAKGQTPLDVLKCLQSELDSQQKQIDTQQKRIAELEKENQRLRQAISVSGNGNVGIGTVSPGAKLDIAGDAKITGKLTHGCPAGMANAGGYCIHTISPYPRGQNWWQALDACIADGYRLCSQSEVVNALRAGVIKQYYWSEGNSWYQTASQIKTSLGEGKDNEVCIVQGSINQPKYPQYSVLCHEGKSWLGQWRTTVCCY